MHFFLFENDSLRVDNTTKQSVTMEMDNRTALETSHGNFSSRDTRMTKTELYILVLEYVLSFEFLVCFLANLLTISAVAKFDYLHKKPTNILIVSFSVADGCVGKYTDLASIIPMEYIHLIKNE